MIEAQFFFAAAAGIGLSLSVLQMTLFARLVISIQNFPALRFFRMYLFALLPITIPLTLFATSIIGLLFASEGGLESTRGTTLTPPPLTNIVEHLSVALDITRTVPIRLMLSVLAPLPGVFLLFSAVSASARTVLWNSILEQMKESVARSGEGRE